MEPAPIPEWLRALVEEARRRWLRATILHELGRWFLLAGAVVVVWSLLLFIWPQTAGWMGLVALVFWTALAMQLFSIWQKQPSDTRLMAMLDRRLDLPDEMLSAGELQDQPSALLALQHADVRRHTEGLDWRRTWPVKPDRYFGVSILAVILLGSLIGYTGWVESLENRIAPPPNKVATRAEAFEKVVKDWEKAAEFEQAEEFEELAKDLRDLVEKMREGEMTEREVALELAAIEDSIRARQEALEEQSWDDLASDMAEATENIEGLSGMSAALRRQDYEQAAAEAGEAAEKLEKQERRAVREEDAQQTGEQLGKLAKQMSQRGNQSMQNALQQMQQGAQQGANQKLAQGLQQMKTGMQQQGKAGKQGKALAMGLAQLGEMKKANAMGQMNAPGMGSLLAQMQGNQAGTAPGAEPNGKDSSLDAEREMVQLSGVHGEGESQRQVMESEQGTATRVSAGEAARFEEYEKMSFEAIENEKLPLSHREVIRAYFQGLRQGQGEAGEGGR